METHDLYLKKKEISTTVALIVSERNLNSNCGGCKKKKQGLSFIFAASSFVEVVLFLVSLG